MQNYMQAGSSQQHQQQHQHSRPNSNHANQPMNLQTSGLDLEYANLLPNNWQFQLQQAAQQHQYQLQTSNTLDMNAYNPAAFGGQLQASPVDFSIPVTNADSYAMNAGMASTNFMTMAGPMESMNALVYPLNDYQNDATFALALNQAALNQQAAESVHSSIPGGSPTGTILEVQSVSDNEWSMINYNPNRNSFDSFTGTVSNPSQNLHIRTNSDSSTSDGPNSAELSGSCLLYTSPSPRDGLLSRMPSSA